MKTSVGVICSFVLLFCVTVLFSSFGIDRQVAPAFSFPFKKAGLTERQAAAHLLSRFTYGAKQGDVDLVLSIGLEKWFLQQLETKQNDDVLDKKLMDYPDINLSNTEVENKYPRKAKVLRMAIRDSVIRKDSINKGDGKAYRQQLQDYMESHGLKPERVLLKQFINQKILRAAYTNNQLQELLTDFWFNHFNVSLTKNQCATFVPAFERDVIRPSVTGRFETLLLATAKSPAMLIYLDNFTSTGEERPVVAGEMQIMNHKPQRAAKPATTKKKGGGLNENYAREVMELHTLGVDGGYTQSDVTEAARILTGWTLAPMGEDGYGAGMEKVMEKIGAANLEKRGFVREGDFLFVPTKHDNGAKTVMGKKFAAGGGYQEGVNLLSMLAHHQNTAKFISRKLALRFVNDHPSQKLIDKMTKTFMSTDGNIKQVMMCMASSPEFWDKDALREKTKSPFELAMSAVRSLNADITDPYQLFGWINRMGQKMYYYQAPTGFPDRGQYWINTGALLNRMNFGLALAAQRIPGVKINLAALNHHHEPESAEMALLTYSKLIMPERNLEQTIKRLKPMLSEPELAAKVQKAASKMPPVKLSGDLSAEGEMQLQPVAKADAPKKEIDTAQLSKANNAMLAQVVGVIIGSPEFQRK